MPIHYSPDNLPPWQEEDKRRFESYLSIFTQEALKAIEDSRSEDSSDDSNEELHLQEEIVKMVWTPFKMIRSFFQRNGEKDNNNEKRCDTTQLNFF